MKKTFIIFLLILSTVTVSAQRAPIKLGKVNVSDLKMNHYPGDSTVDAAILFDYGYFDADYFLFHHMRRLKIFTKEGLGNLIFTAPIDLKSDFKGFVINLENGKVVKEKISTEHVFITRSEGFASIRIAPPNVREGSIVDISFYYQGYPTIWQFQQNIPVSYSELYFPYNENIAFKFQQIGLGSLEKVNQSKFIARDLPAFVPEPYINSDANYRTAIQIDLKSYHVWNDYGSAFLGMATAWEDVNDYLHESEPFYGNMSYPNLFLYSTASEIEEKALSMDERLELAFQAIQENVTWNNVIDKYPERNLKEKWDEGTGSASDMNFMLMSLLKKLNFNVHPLVISSRARGKINPLYPTVNRFNTVICHVEYQGKEIILDASDKYCYPGFLPNRSLNEGGFLIDDEKGRWVDYSPDKSRSTMYSCNMQMDESGVLKGEIAITHRDYAAINFLREYEEYSNESDYLQEMEKDYNGMFIESYENDLTKSKQGSIREILQVEMDNYTSSIGDMITFNPVLMERWEENPFKTETRAYPVDFITAWDELSIFTIAIPEGYEVIQLPQSLSLVTENKSVQFQYMIQQVGSNIQLMVKFAVKKPVFIESEYPELKILFNAVVEKENENIILKKIQP